jgi:hypothetical protein
MIRDELRSPHRLIEIVHLESWNWISGYRTCQEFDTVALVGFRSRWSTVSPFSLVLPPFPLQAGPVCTQQNTKAFGAISRTILSSATLGAAPSSR